MIIDLGVEYIIGVVTLIGKVWLSRNLVSESGCKIEISTLLLAVNILTDLWREVTAVGILTGCFDIDDV